jgi:integral membrane protein
VTPHNFRILGYIEGISLLLLLFFAMPLKYLADVPEAVSIVGMTHGVLFTAYALLALLLLEELGWGYAKLLFALLVASIPFGPFIFERQLFPKMVTIVAD